MKRATFIQSLSLKDVTSAPLTGSSTPQRKPDQLHLEDSTTW